MGATNVADCITRNPNAPDPPAAGRFGLITPGVEPHAYRPQDCPSLEQFETRFLLAEKATRPASPARP